jgi:hypothetical protein
LQRAGLFCNGTYFVATGCAALQRVYALQRDVAALQRDVAT